MVMLVAKIIQAVLLVFVTLVILEMDGYQEMNAKTLMSVQIQQPLTIVMMMLLAKIQLVVFFANVILGTLELVKLVMVVKSVY